MSEAEKQDMSATTVDQHGADAVHHGYDHLYQDPAFWVAMAIISFFLFLIWKKIPAMVGRMLDDKAKVIADQLDNAQSLREEASSLLAKYQRDQRDAQKIADDMMAHAESEIALLQNESTAQVEEMVRRRTKLAEQKIAQAEANALKEIQQTAVHVAALTARELIGENLKKTDHDALIKQAIDTMDTQIH